MTYDLNDYVCLKSNIGQTYYYCSLSELFKHVDWHIVNSLGDSFYEGKDKYSYNHQYVVYDICNFPIPSSVVRKLFEEFNTKNSKRIKSKYKTFCIPVYRCGPIDGVRNYGAAGWHGHRLFRHYFPELRELNDLKHNEDAKYYNCFPRKKRVNKPNPWDDIRCGAHWKTWKRYRKKQYKLK